MSRPDTCNAHDFIVSASALSSPCLDLSKKGISQLPSEFPGCGKLEVKTRYVLINALRVARMYIRTYDNSLYYPWNV